MIVLLALASGCSDYSLSEQKTGDVLLPRIEVRPTSLGFGGVEPGQVGSQVFTVSSVGDVPLEILGLELDAPSTFTLVAGDVTGLWDPGESFDVVVEYRPEERVDSGQALVHSDDPATPTAVVELLGDGLVPNVVAEPDPYDFGQVEVATTEVGTVTVSNLGSGAATILDIADSGGAFYSSHALSLPTTLDAGASFDVTVAFTPDAEGAFSGELVVDTAEQGPVTVELQGEGYEVQAPVAVCYADPSQVEPLSSPVTWVGSDSYDPSGGRIVDYDWTLVTVPAGSAATMPAGSSSQPDRTNFRPDLAGTYEAQLVVTNDAGVSSAPCIAELEVVPAEDLWIEMYWAVADDDMDLHLIAPGGTPYSNTDCYYQNCVGGGLDWGVRGDPRDDPALDLDDIPGTGPENINIADPADGVYTVMVNDYVWFGTDFTGPNDVTVNIYVGGVLEWTGTKTITGNGADVDFALVDWPSGVVTPL